MPQSLLSKFPIEIQAFILSQVAIYAPKTYVELLACGFDLQIPFNSPLIWQPICTTIYPDLENIDIDVYGGYFNLFKKRPTIRFNGVYVCKAQYVRSGIQTGISFLTPQHLVTYYRYLWFNMDQTASSLLSNLPPKSVLGFDGTQSNSVYDDLMHGTWHLDPETKCLKVMVDGGNKRNTFFNFELIVSSSGGKCHNKLKWRRYYSIEKNTHLETDFSFKNEQSYYFCKLPPDEIVAAGGDCEVQGGSV